MTKISVIIVAAGKGLRMGAELPKQFLSLSSRPILMRTIEKFACAIPDMDLIVALHEDYFSYWKELCDDYAFTIPHRIVKGGDTRFQSVRNCVAVLEPDSECVLIHDGVRPFVSSKLILRVVEAVREYGAVIPATDVVDSLRRVLSPLESEIVDRSMLKAVQTPQGFTKEILEKGYTQNDHVLFTDDASVVEAAGYSVKVIDGERYNLKITTLEDLQLGELMTGDKKSRKFSL